jgi:hypothetical protein
MARGLGPEVHSAGNKGEVYSSGSGGGSDRLGGRSTVDLDKGRIWRDGEG